MPNPNYIFANTINGNPLYADRAEHDADGNLISTTYATKSELPSSSSLVPASTSSDANKVLTVNAQGSAEWAAGGTGGSNVFMATSTTTFPELWQAFHVEKKLVYCAAESKLSSLTPYFLQTLKSSNSSNTTGSATFVQFNKNASGSLEVLDATVWFNSTGATLGNVTFNSKIIIPSNPGSHAGEFLSASSNGNMVFASVNQVPSSTSSDEDKVLTVNSSGTPVWVTPSGGTTYTAGNMISLANDAIAVSTTAGITDIQQVASLPANPVSTVLYLIPET